MATKAGEHRDLGIGGIVGGGIFATLGLAGAQARGATPLSFIIGGLVALLTAYSYVRLSATYPGPGGTVTFVNRAFGAVLFIAVLALSPFVHQLAYRRIAPWRKARG